MPIFYWDKTKSGTGLGTNTLTTSTKPKTGQRLPVIGMGTWRTFNVGSDPQLLNARAEVVRAFFQHGGGLIDSSPMYGSAPDVIGHALKQLGSPDSLFSAEKVWCPTGGSADRASLGLCRPGYCAGVDPACRPRH